MKAREECVGELLKAQGKTIACAESCTGGLLTSRLTDVPGSSSYVRGAVVSYTNEVKEQLVGVRPETIDAYTEISAETAREMAQGIRRLLSTDIGVGITGLAGPGGMAGKPAGLVYIAVSGSRGTVVKPCQFQGGRLSVKQQSADQALQMIQDYLGGLI